MKRVDGGWQVATSSLRWSYALQFVPFSVPTDGEYRFEITYCMQQGDITFGALSEDQSRWLKQAGKGICKKGPGWLTKSFTLFLKSGETIRLLIANDHPEGAAPSRFCLNATRAFLKKQPNRELKDAASPARRDGQD
jgi:hypothetical protein